MLHYPVTTLLKRLVQHKPCKCSATRRVSQKIEEGARGEGGERGQGAGRALKGRGDDAVEGLRQKGGQMHPLVMVAHTVHERVADVHLGWP